MCLLPLFFFLFLFYTLQDFTWLDAPCLFHFYSISSYILLQYPKPTQTLHTSTKMQKFTTGIEMELHISPKIICRKSLRRKGYDDSRSAPKADKQSKDNLKCVYQFLKTEMNNFNCPAFVKDDQSGNDYKKWAIEEDISILTEDKGTCTCNLFIVRSNSYSRSLSRYFQILSCRN